MKKSINSAVLALSQHYETRIRPNREVVFRIEGYAIDFKDRGPERLVATFAAKSPDHQTKPATSKPGWGKEFLHKLGISSLLVKSDRNDWYRLPSLARFMADARDAGLFDGFARRMTYGGSMGGFGALSFSGIIGAHICLAHNPQVNLGDSVRSWERRFPYARDLDWDDALCDIDRQIRDVARVVVTYDPYHMTDRRQVELLTGGHLTRLHVPFVGHRMPHHLKDMGVLSWVFHQCWEQEFDTAEFYRRIRARRTLPRYRDTLIAKTKNHPSRNQRIRDLLPDTATLSAVAT